MSKTLFLIEDINVKFYYWPNLANLTRCGPTLTLRGPCNDVSNNVNIVFAMDERIKTTSKIIVNINVKTTW